MITLLYFAWVRERIGMAEERLAVPAGITHVAALLDWLALRSAGHAAALADRAALRVAVNQAHVRLDHAIHDGDEVALFPPVTGG